MKSLCVLAAAITSTLLGTLNPAQAFDLQPPKESQFTLGAGMALLPEYIGDQEYQFVVTPAIKGAWVSDTLGTFAVGYGAHGGLSWSPFNLAKSEIALVTDYASGRADSDDGHHYLFGSDYLKGMGEIKETPELGLRASTTLLPWLTLHSQLMWGLGNTGHKGAWGDVGLEASSYLSESLEGSFDIGTSWGDGDYMSSFYGVTKQQAQNSRFQAYSAGAGIKDVSVSAGLRYHFTPQMSLESHVGMISLIGDAADSPLVREQNNLVASMMFLYRF
ncbi:MAG: MipA/OmpV family protein [Aeromonadaceae bacterium]